MAEQESNLLSTSGARNNVSTNSPYLLVGDNYNALDWGLNQKIAISLRNFKKVPILDPYIATKRLHKLYFLLDQAPCYLTACPSSFPTMAYQA